MQNSYFLERAFVKVLVQRRKLKVCYIQSFPPKIKSISAKYIISITVKIYELQSMKLKIFFFDEQSQI